jgi:hypothetical protein
MTGLEDALKAKDYSAAMDAIPWDKLDQMQYDIDPELRSVLFKAGAVAARQLLPKGIKISFDQTNPAAVEWVRAHAAELVTQNIIPTTQESIRKILTRAFEEGITPADAARLIREYIGILPRHADAVEKYRQALIKKFRDDYKYVTWESDSARLAGRYAQQLINYRAKNIARTECLPGDTLVDGAVVGAVYRRWYEGYLIEVVTSNGRIFSASPNHPMLASVGWVTAEQLTESNYLICNTGKKDICSTSNLNVKRNPSTISEIFDSVQAISAFERRNSIPPDFHGDGRYGYDDILTHNRELTILERDSAINAEDFLRLIRLSAAARDLIG